MSQLEVDKIIPQSGTTLTIGDSGDTISLPSEVSLDTLTITGDLTVDTDTLYVDSTNNNVGIGTTSPNSYTNYQTLTINGTTGGVLDFESNGTLIGEIFNESDKLIIQSTSTNPIVVKTNNSERMRIDSSGNVGIGTTSPLSKLDVFGPSSVTSFTGTSHLGLTVRGSSAATDYSGIDFIGNNQVNPIARVGVLTTGSGSFLSFGTSNNYGSGVTNMAMTIDQTGDVGIGTTSPSGKLHIADGTVRISKATDPRLEIDCNSGSSGSQVVLQESNSDRARYEWDGTFLRLGTTVNGGDWFLERNGTNCATVTSSGVLNTSDARVKSNIRDADVGLDEILNLSAKLFERNSSPDITELGLIAQDIESAGIPYTIIESGHSGEEIKSVNPMGLIATLVNAVKELKTKNDSLEARITALENT